MSKKVDLNAYGQLADDISHVIISPDELHQRITEIGAAITQDYANRNPIFIGVLKGVVFFMADLLRTLPFHVEVDFMAVASYDPSARQRGVVRLEKDLNIPIENRHVIFVEDMIDTGLTLNYLLRSLRARQPATLEICALFNKPRRRLIDIPIKYKGFDLPNRFVVGYGLDYREKYRHLPFIGQLKADVLPSDD
ncbi:MAG TPA: hypoxanthine phosphoribosyltransferase [Anaerolineae bacterium]|nr:hypoxanthine phosphoribosyltransferase [Anaerolineae bacterium]